MWYIMYAAAIKENCSYANFKEDTDKQIIIYINEYNICLWKLDKGRVLIHSYFPNKTFLEVTIESKEDLIKLLKQLYIIK